MNCSEEAYIPVTSKHHLNSTHTTNQQHSLNQNSALLRRHMAYTRRRMFSFPFLKPNVLLCCQHVVPHEVLSFLLPVFYYFLIVRRLQRSVRSTIRSDIPTIAQRRITIFSVIKMLENPDDNIVFQMMVIFSKP